VAAPIPPGWVWSASDGWWAPKGMTPDGRRLAQPGKRFLGFFLDGLITFLPMMALAVVAIVIVAGSAAASVNEDGAADGTAGAGFVIGILGLYALIFVFSIGVFVLEAELLYRRGRTWGMGWSGLRVIDAKTGGPISRGRAYARTAFARFISGQVFGFGFWWAFFDDRNRTLHDLVVGTVVIEEG
jgi:uncharacterized RDD family membrane protein YckC